MTVFSIARLVAAAAGANTINVPTVNIFLQKSPNKPSGDQRGITGANFEVVKDDTVIQTGTTGADGKVVMLVPGGSATLRITTPGATAEYAVTIRSDPIEAVTAVIGQKRRLRMLGYHLGHGLPDGNGVDTVAIPDVEMDRSIMEFEEDAPEINAAGNIDFVNGFTHPQFQSALTTAAGA